LEGDGVCGHVYVPAAHRVALVDTTHETVWYFTTSEQHGARGNDVEHPRSPASDPRQESQKGAPQAEARHGQPSSTGVLPPKQKEGRREHGRRAPNAGNRTRTDATEARSVSNRTTPTQTVSRPAGADRNASTATSATTGSAICSNPTTDWPPSCQRAASACATTSAEEDAPAAMPAGSSTTRALKVR
jgi:hypothetical protein